LYLNISKYNKESILQGEQFNNNVKFPVSWDMRETRDRIYPPGYESVSLVPHPKFSSLPDIHRQFASRQDVLNI